ncbi:hypothetical protein BASA83_001839 [Batrachochytrium salamandrivorans]|nr:hypothetical protein BASA83_001839 [Batrachochytrium salamandrivorans]
MPASPLRRSTRREHIESLASPVSATHPSSNSSLAACASPRPDTHTAAVVESVPIAPTPEYTRMTPVKAADVSDVQDNQSVNSSGLESIASETSEIDTDVSANMTSSPEVASVDPDTQHRQSDEDVSASSDVAESVIIPKTTVNRTPLTPGPQKGKRGETLDLSTLVKPNITMPITFDSSAPTPPAAREVVGKRKRPSGNDQKTPSRKASLLASSSTGEPASLAATPLSARVIKRKRIRLMPLEAASGDNDDYEDDHPIEGERKAVSFSEPTNMVFASSPSCSNTKTPSVLNMDSRVDLIANNDRNEKLRRIRLQEERQEDLRRHLAEQETRNPRLRRILAKLQEPVASVTSRPVARHGENNDRLLPSTLESSGSYRTQPPPLGPNDLEHAPLAADGQSGRAREYPHSRQQQHNPHYFSQPSRQIFPDRSDYSHTLGHSSHGPQGPDSSHPEGAQAYPSYAQPYVQPFEYGRPIKDRSTDGMSYSVYPTHLPVNHAALGGQWFRDGGHNPPQTMNGHNPHFFTTGRTHRPQDYVDGVVPRATAHPYGYDSISPEMKGGNAHVSRSAVLNPYCPLPSIQQPRHDDSMGNNLPRNVEYAHQQNHQHNQYHRNATITLICTTIHLSYGLYACQSILCGRFRFAISKYEMALVEHLIFSLRKVLATKHNSDMNELMWFT